MRIFDTLVVIRGTLHYLVKVLAVCQSTFIHCRRIQSEPNLPCWRLLQSYNSVFAYSKYFHKVICQSGVALNEWAIERHPEEKTRKLAKLLGCKSQDPHEILGRVFVDSGETKI